MRVRGFGRAVMVVAMSVALVAACGKSGSPSTSSSSGEKAPSTVKADAKYAESTLPIDSRPLGLAVAPNGDLYLTTEKGLESLASGANEPRVVVPDLPHGFGLAVTEARAFVGNNEKLEVVDLSKGSPSEVQVSDVETIRGVGLDRDENVYVLGVTPDQNGFPSGRVVKLNRDLSAPTVLPFPGGPGYADIAVGPDGTTYVTNPLLDNILVLHPGDTKTSELHLDGAKGPVRVALSPAGDMLVVDNVNPGTLSTSPQAMRLLRYPAGSNSPVEIANYQTNVYWIGGDVAGNVYYTATDGDKVRVVKLSPKP